MGYGVREQSRPLGRAVCASFYTTLIRLQGDCTAVSDAEMLKRSMAGEEGHSVTYWCNH